ncbi:MAG: fumarylacetoacetate hydrolase family protein [Gammaproteobacteria bacterium]
MNEQTRALAEALVAARREQETLLAADWQSALADAVAAYAVQASAADAFGWCPDGVARNWKSGGPSRDIELTHAPLPPEGVMTSPADFSSWSFHAPFVEAEIALRLGRDVTPEAAAQLDPANAAEWVDAMCVSIEIVDSRWAEGAQAPALLRLADLQSHGALALGNWLSYAPRDWATQQCEVRIGQQAPQVFTGTYSLGDPTWLLPVWLRHATRAGATVPSGTVVTTGSWVGMLPAQKGDAVSVRFEGIGEARLQL